MTSSSASAPSRRWRRKHEDCPQQTLAVAHAVAGNRSVAEIATEHRLGWATVQQCVDELIDAVRTVVAATAVKVAIARLAVRRT